MNNDTSTVTINPMDNSWQNATGKIPISMTNDYLFCTMLERNNNVLKSLISALLHLPPEEIQTADIQNPVSKGINDEKTIILDVKVLLNQNTILNLELQVLNEHNWPERSIYYLCNCFENLNSGDDYIDVKPAIHISILNFTLFPKAPEFYATYYMMNEKSHALYSDKFRISVLSLNQIKRATKEDKSYHIDHWARLFKCKDWRELQMLANSDDNIKEAVSTVYELTQDKYIQYKCQQREEAIRRINTDKRLAEKYKAEKEQLSSEIEHLSSAYNQVSSENEKLKQLLKDHNIDPNT